MIVRLAEAAAEAIALHLRSVYPNEGCGQLVGAISPGKCSISRAIPAPNLSSRSNRFEIDPLSFRDTEVALSQSAQQQKIIGFFHSHPDAPAIPSSADLDGARGLFQFTREHHIYAIQRIGSDAAYELRFWRLNSSALEFEELSWIGEAE